MAEGCNVNNTIYLTDETAHSVSHTKEDTIFVTIGIPLVSVFGLVNNLAFLFVLYRVNSMRSLTNFYLGNLAVADAWILIITSVRHLWAYAAISPIGRGMPWKNPVACMLPFYLTYVATYCSVFLVALVSAERYFAICHPLRHRVINSKRRAVALVLMAWLLSFIMAGFANSPSSTRQTCYVLPEGKQTVVVFTCVKPCTFCTPTIYIFDTVQFFTAFFTSTAMYILIVIKVSKRKLVETNVNNDVRNAVLRMVITNAVIFFLCLMPFQIINVQDVVIMVFGGQSFLSRKAYDLISWIGRVTWLLNSAVNPLVYSLTNSKYRRAFFEAFNLRRVKTTSINQTNHTQVRSVSQTQSLDTFKVDSGGNQA